MIRASDPAVGNKARCPGVSFGDQGVKARVNQLKGDVMTDRRDRENGVPKIDARRQRIVISQTTISWVRWFGLLVTGLCVMIGIAFAHLDNRRNCRIALTLFATGMAASILIIAAHSRPFNTTVSPERLYEIKAQYSID
jgi:hypothetical protein